MESNNFTIEHETRFLTNNGDFNEQPIFTMTNSKALTGSYFINVSRVVGKDANVHTAGDSYHEGLSGFMKLTVGTSTGVISLSGTSEISSNYVKGISANPVDLGMTAQAEQYKVNLSMVGRNKMVLFTKVNNIPSHELTTTGFASFTGSNTNMNVFGTGFRPDPEGVLNPDGTTGKSLILQYFFNRMEMESENFVTSGLTGIKDRSGNGISASIFGKGVGTISSIDLTNASSGANIATVTGWTYGVPEGGFRLDGNTYVESDSSSLFNINGVASSSMSVISFMKISSTSDQVLMVVGSGTTEVFRVAVVSGSVSQTRKRTGVLKFHVGTHSFTGLSDGLEIGKFHQIGLTIDGSSNVGSQGVSAYHNGTLIASTGVTVFPNLVSNGRLIFGRELDRGSASSLTGTIGLTRIFNRSLSSAEVALNYFAYIPAMQDSNCIRLAAIQS